MLSKFNRLLAIWRLKNRYLYLKEVDKLMEEFVTETILNGGSPEFIGVQRKQLVQLQNEIKSKDKLLAFLRKI